MNPLTSMSLNSQVDLKVFTKLMERLDVTDSQDLSALCHTVGADADSTSAVTELSAISDKDGNDVVFANNPGNEATTPQGAVCYNFGSAVSAMNAVPVPLYGHGITGGKSCGILRAYVLRDGDVYTSEERTPLSGKFTKEQKLPVTVPNNCKGIQKLQVCQFEDNYALFIVTETFDGACFVTVHYGDEQYDRMVPKAFGTGMFAFYGSSKDNLRVYQISEVRGTLYYTSMSLADEVLQRYEFTLKEPHELPKEMAVVGGGVFLLSTAGNLYVLNVRDNSCDAVYLKNYGESSGLIMGQDKKFLHACFLNGQGALLHGYLSAGELSFNATGCFPLDNGVSAVAISPYVNSATIYYFSTKAGKLIRLSYDAESDNWVDLGIDIPEPGQIMKLPCYSTEITLLDKEKRTPLIGTKVQVWTEQRTYLQTRDRIEVCDSGHKLLLKTDVQGKITFAQYTNKMDVPVIYASLPPELMAEDDCLAISQYETVSGKMSSLKPEDILNARMTDSMKGDTGYLLADKYRNQKNADAMVKSIKQVMALKNTITGTGVPQAPMHSPYTKGTYLIKRNEIGQMKRLCITNDMPAWRLSVSGGQLSYSDLNDAEYTECLASMRQSDAWMPAEEFDSIFSKIGDFFRGIVKKIIHVIDIVVKGVTATVKFILDGIERIYDFVITTVGAVLDFIETIFTIVAVFFVSLFAWIAALFMWDDVKRMQRLLKGVANGFMESVPKGIDAARTRFSSYIHSFDDKIDQKIDEICSSFLPGESLISHVTDHSPSDPETEEAMSNNYLLDKLCAVQGDVCRTVALNIGQQDQDALNSVLDILENFTDEIKSSDGWAQAYDAIKNIFDSETDIFTKITVALLQVLKGLIHAVLSGIDTVVSAFLNILSSLARLLWQTMTTEIDIPFFSGLYRAMTGDGLSVLNVVTFVVSVLIVLMVKLFRNDSLYKSNAAVDAAICSAKECFVWEKQDGSLSRKYVNQKDQDNLSIAAFCFGYVNYILAAFSDASTQKSVAPDPAPDPDPVSSVSIFEKYSLLGGICLLVEFSWLILSLPWYYESEEEKADWMSVLLWCTFLAGTALDGYIYYKDGEHIDRVDKMSRRLTSGYGAAHLVIAVICAACGTKWYDYVPELGGALSESFKFLIDITLDNESNYWPKILAVSTDAIAASALAAAMLGKYIEGDNAYGTKI